MAQTTHTNLRTLSCACFIGAMLMVGVMTPTQQAAAQTAPITEVQRAAMLQQIQQLLETIVVLQRKITTIDGQKEGENLINNNSIAQANTDIKLYKTPGVLSGIVGTQDAGAVGEVVDGPKLVAGKVWWQFKFRDNSIGWSSEEEFVRIPSTILRVDVNQDGVHDISMRFEGEYDLDGFVVEPGEDGTYIRYKGKPVESFSTKQLKVDSKDVDVSISNIYPKLNQSILADRHYTVYWEIENLPKTNNLQIRGELQSRKDQQVISLFLAEAKEGKNTKRVDLKNVSSLVPAGEYRYVIKLYEKDISTNKFELLTSTAGGWFGLSYTQQLM